MLLLPSYYKYAAVPLPFPCLAILNSEGQFSVMDALKSLLAGCLPATKSSPREAKRLLGTQSGGNILHLPDEVLLAIFDALDYTTAVALTSAHKRFWKIVNPATFYSQERKSADLDHAQNNYLRFEGRLACHGCFCILPRCRFMGLDAQTLLTWGRCRRRYQCFHVALEPMTWELSPKGLVALYLRCGWWAQDVYEWEE